ncbi:hypothetical protein PAECIP111893_03843 [Paenibacillus plantiphilus]|uniref:Aminoglycoside phosphotransferase domain-containing protein n=1 Tax=Paenibacillus plantiphilus TaxID=2905650 RepID=A0ABM9CHY6_9BACL|nr:aminoglycoside phosphotransferase family protein [Paenibacillus plantiphilus]CAH1214750.1 hypothetical protein PAECIP111893_03843 [Paenibacillus plantiphilus]
MGTSIGNVNWIEKNEMMDALLKQEDSLTTQLMEQGFEAEVMKIGSLKESFVLKVWNKSSKPDVSVQFRLLNVLFERGVSVSKPVGWGMNPNGEQVLLTTFDGTPVTSMNKKKMTDIAEILSSIHQTLVNEIGNLHLPKYDFIDYFFPGVCEHTDLHHALLSLVHSTPIKQERIIHGDFHLRNILEANGRYTVIDWTNGQLGDPRYDFAWSLVLQKIYFSERYAQVFRSAYLRDSDIQPKELEAFEALACLRWILLYRNGDIPKGSNAIKRVEGVIINNPFLKKVEFVL